MLDRVLERRLIAQVAARIEKAQSQSVEYADPGIRELAERWQKMSRAVRDIRNALEKAIADRRERVCGADRATLQMAKRQYPDLLLVEMDGELLPARCIVTGLALFDGDELYGDPETGFAVLRKAVTAREPGIVLESSNT